MAGPELDDLAYQAAAGALIAITGKLGQFRGESRFTTGPISSSSPRYWPRSDLLAALRRSVDEELTTRPRTVFVAIVLNGVPLDARVIELASNRNAICKTLFDARRKLRAALPADGYVGDD